MAFFPRYILAGALLAALLPARGAVPLAVRLDGVLHVAAAGGRTLTVSEATVDLAYADRLHLAYTRLRGDGAGRHVSNTYADDGWQLAGGLTLRPQTGRLPRVDVGYRHARDAVRLSVHEPSLSLDAAPVLTTDTVDAHLVWRRGRAEGALGAGVAHLALFDHDAATVRELDGGGTYTLSRRWTLKATLLAAQDDRPGRHTAYAGTLRAVFGLATQTTLALGGTLCLHGTPLTGVPPAPLAAAVTVLGLDNAVGDFHDGTLGLFSLSARVAW